MQVGDKIDLTNDRHGIIKYIGETEFDSESDEMIGVELNTPDKNGNGTNGTFGNKEYFKAKIGHGVFVKRVSIISVTSCSGAGSGAHSNNNNNMYKNNTTDPDVNHGSMTTMNVTDTNGGDDTLTIEIGDIVTLDDGEIGQVKFLGEVDFAKGEMLGLEMENWVRDETDGSKDGKRYFTAQAGCGKFTRRNRVKSVLKSVQIEKERKEKHNEIFEFGSDSTGDDSSEGSDDSGKPFFVNSIITKKYELELAVGDRVKLTKNRLATTKYIGKTHFSSERHIGVELDNPSPKGHDGTVGGKRYFRCKPENGLFLPRSSVLSKLDSNNNDNNNNNNSVSNTKDLKSIDGIFDDRNDLFSSILEKTDHEKLQLKQYRLIRKLQTKLRKINLHKNDIERQLRELQDAFVKNKPPSQIDGIDKHVNREPTSKSKNKNENNHPMIEIKEFSNDDCVTLDSGEISKIVFCGNVHFDNRKMFGIVLNKFSPNGHDGSVDGKPYFACKNGYGLLVPHSSIVKVNSHKCTTDPDDDDEKETYEINETLFGVNKSRVENKIHNQENTDELWDDNQDFALEELPELEFKLGDRIQLAHGETGTVKFIGNVNLESTNGDEKKQEEVIGLELDSWSPNASNGSINGNIIFDTSPGHGYFLVRRSIADMFTSSTIEGSIVRLKGLEKVSKLNGKAVKIVSHVREKARWKVLLLDSEKQPEKKYFDVSEKNLEGIFNWRSKQNTYVESLATMPNIGDRVKMRNGKWGVVKFIGKTKFDEEKIIGLELNDWNPNGHDGKAKDVRYFTAKPGRGWFTTLEFLIENRYKAPVKSSSSSTREREASVNVPTPASLPIKIGDRVQLRDGKAGVVKYIGDEKNDSNKLRIGLELDSWTSDLTTDTVDGRRYVTESRSIVCIIPKQEKTIDERKEIARKKGISQMKKRLREIDLLELKYKNNVHLDARQLRKIQRKDFYAEKLKDFEDGTFELDEKIRPPPKNLPRLATKSTSEEDENIIQRQSDEFEKKSKDDKEFTSRENGNNNNDDDKDDDWIEVNLNDYIRVVGDKVGIVKHVGPVKFTNEAVIGILLSKWCSNACNGLVQGHRYFDAPPGRGYFVKHSLVLENMGPEYVYTDSDLNSPTSSKIKVQLGDRVELSGNKAGVVKFIGRTAFAKDEVVGVELDRSWSGGHDGVVRGKRYFKCPKGRGYFCRRQSITNVEMGNETSMPA